MKEHTKAYLDNELNLIQRQRFESELDSSPALQQELNDLKRLKSAIGEIDAGTPYGKDQLLEKLSKASNHQKENRKLWKNGLSISFCFLVLTVVFWPPYAISNSQALKRERMGAMSSSVPAEIKGGATAERSKAFLDSDKEPLRNPVGAVPMATKKRSLRLGDGASNGAPLDTPAGIYVERSGSIEVEVKDLSASVDRVTGIVSNFEGFVVSSRLDQTADGGTANVVLRVPTLAFTAILTKLKEMGRVMSMTNNSLDITEPTVDNTARMNFWAVEEQRLIAELNRTPNSKQWTIRNQLSQVRANLEAYRAQVKSLRERAKFSTIEAKFTTNAETESNWSGSAAKDAKSILFGLGKSVGQALIYVAILIPVWLPLAVVAWMVARRNRRL